MTAVMRYVPHEEVDWYLEHGWTIASDLAKTHHGRHAVLMEYYER